MVTIWSLVLLGFAAFLTPCECIPIRNFVDGVENLLELIRPVQILTVFCNNDDKEFELIRRISTSENKNGRLSSISRLTGSSATDEYHRNFYIVDITCSYPHLLKIFEKNPLGFIYSHWLILNTTNEFGFVSEDNIRILFNPVRISQSSEIFFFSSSSSAPPDTLSIKLVYKMEKLSDDVLIEDFGDFVNCSSDPRFINKRSLVVTIIRRRNLQGKEFSLGSVMSRPDSINHVFDFVDVDVDTIGKMGHKLGVVVLQFMNATPTTIVRNSWGVPNATTGQWSGMIGDMVAGDTELGGTAMFLRKERTAVVEYMSVGLESWTKIVFRAPKLSYTTNVYLLPFERGVWGAAIILFIAMTFLLLLSARGEWNILLVKAERGEVMDSPDVVKSLRPRLIDIVFVIFSAICNQGSSYNPLSVGGRIILLSCLVMVVCLFVSYCAFIVVLLQSPATNIQNAQDLLNSRIQIGCEDTIYNRFWLKLLTDPVEKALYEKRIVNKDGSLNFYPLEEGVRKIQQRLFAFHMETPIGYRIISQLYDEAEKCDLREISFADMKNPYAACRKHSPFREVLRVGLLRVAEHGIQRRQWNEIYRTKPKCNNRSGFIPLTLIDISPAILILCFGCGTSFIILFAEVLIDRYRKRLAQE